MAGSINTNIVFGETSILISLFSATRDNDIQFNQLHKEDHHRIRYQKYCGHCGEAVGPNDLVKGYEYARGRYVTIRDDELEALKNDDDRMIHIVQVVKLRDIPPIYFDKTYHAIPDAGSEKPYETLRRVLLKRNRAAIAKTVLGFKGALIALIPTSTGILAETLFFPDEVKSMPQTVGRPKIQPAILELAEQAVGLLEKPFHPEDYKDEYRERVMKLITEKINQKSKSKTFNNISLEETLKKSIQILSAPKAKSDQPSARQ